MPSASPDPIAESRPHAGADHRAEAEWVDRACEGSAEAFEALARASMPMLLGTARRLAGPGYAAEEAVAEALFRAWRRIDSFRGASGFGTWLHRILVRVIADRYRTAGRARKHDQAARDRVRAGDAVAGQPSAMPSPIQELAARDDAHRWRLLLDALPHTQRLVLLLHAWENLSLAEIAETLGLRYATVKSNLHHARKAIRAAWDAGTGRAS